MSTSFLKKRYDTSNLQQTEVELAKTLRKFPIPDDELMKNLGLFLTPGALGRILFMDFLYRSTLEQQGVIAEFGCRYGQNLNLFQCLRGIYEPYNRLRKVVGFDTFAGFPSVSKEDGHNDAGDYQVGENYQVKLDEVLLSIEKFAPLDHLPKIQTVAGPVETSLPQYLSDNPHTLFSLCYFDMDLYKPTLEALTLVYERCSKGTVIAFDELNDPDMPGETLAALKFFSGKPVQFKRFLPSARTTYVVIQ